MEAKRFKLIRFPEKHLTKGVLFFENEKVCDTLEDVVRDINADGDLDDLDEGKVYGETAIPYGSYELVVTYSPKFKRKMTLVKDVKHFTGIRLHFGKTIRNSLGCVLVGRANGDTLDNTYMTDKITNMVLSYQKKGIKVFLDIVKP